MWSEGCSSKINIHIFQWFGYFIVRDEKCGDTEVKISAVSRRVKAQRGKK